MEAIEKNNLTVNKNLTLVKPATPTPEELRAASWESQNRTVCLAMVLEYEILEKMPEAFRSQANRNRARQIRQGLQQIAQGTARPKDQEYAEDYTYLIWRIFNVVIGGEYKDVKALADVLDQQLSGK